MKVGDKYLVQTRSQAKSSRSAWNREKFSFAC